MKKFEAPEIEIKTFQAEDVIATSGAVAAFSLRPDETDVG